MKLLNKIILLLIVVSLFSCNSERIGYVDVNKLYEGFKYKKNLTEEFNKIKTARKRILDSLELELNQYATRIEQQNKFNASIENEFEVKKKYFYQLSKQLEEDNQVLIDSYNTKIIAQLNSYLKDFGKKNNYKILLGADNKGNILYGDENSDDTEKALSYINERFEGEAKTK